MQTVSLSAIWTSPEPADQRLTGRVIPRDPAFVWYCTPPTDLPRALSIPCCCPPTPGTPQCQISGGQGSANLTAAPGTAAASHPASETRQVRVLRNSSIHGDRRKLRMTPTTPRLGDFNHVTHLLNASLESILEKQCAGDGVIVGHAAQEEVLWQGQLGEGAAAAPDDCRLGVHL